MLNLRSSRFSAIDVVLVCLFIAAYFVAVSSIAIDGFWTGPDFDFAPMTGWDCLASGWFQFPLGWLSNPILLVGAMFLLFGHRFAALIAAVVAMGLARLWTWEFSHSYSLRLLREGYDWWVGSMLLLAASSLCSMIIHWSDTCKSLTSFFDDAPCPQPPNTLD